MINYYKFRVVSNSVFVINILTINKIKLKRIKKREKDLEFFVKAEYVEDVIKLLTHNAREFEILEDKSFKSFVHSNIYRFGLYCGLLFVILFMVFYANTLTRVEIAGNDLVSDEIIYNEIIEEIEVPSYNKNLDCDVLTKKIIALDGITSASVERKGNTLLVNVYEELPKVEILDKTNYVDIVSKYDTIVTRIVTYSGTAMVKKGDSIRAGQTIFSCTKVIDEELSVQEYANGIAYGRVWFTKEVIIEPTYMTSKRTGNSETFINFFSDKDNSEILYSQYEVEKTKCYLSNIVPLPYYKYTYYETENVIEEINFYDNEEAIVAEYTTSLFNELPEGCTPLRNWYDVNILDKNIKLVIYYEVETNIT
jgi:similar to stage IV sporulation protein